MKKKVAAILAVAGLAVTVPVGAAQAVPTHPCNAGGGNGSEGGTPPINQFHPGTPDCDPGNSGNTGASDND